MTKHEKIVVSAYTGILMCDFGDLHQYIQEKLGRPVWTHELASSEVQDEIKEKTKADFLALCKDSSGEGACPICGYELKMCQCRFGRHGHPDRSKNRDVVLDHLYLLTPAQLDHVIQLQRGFQTSYLKTMAIAMSRPGRIVFGGRRMFFN